MQMMYGAATLVAVALFLIFARSKPPTPPGPPEDEVRALVLDGLKRMLKQREVYFLSFALFLGSGIVNTVFTLIDGLGREKGLTTEQGVTLTVVLLAAGIVGSIVLPVFSDVVRQRKTIILLGIFGAVPATLCLALGKGFDFEIGSCHYFRFLHHRCDARCLPVWRRDHPSGPGRHQQRHFRTLLSRPQGLLIVLMDALKSAFHNSYVPSLVGLAVLIAGSGMLFLMAKESPEMHRRQALRAAAQPPTIPQ
jgi:MFS family permease